MDGGVPVVDLTEDDEKVAKALHSAFQTVGFACLTGTSVWEQAAVYGKLTEDFFTQERKQKAKWTRSEGHNRGWVCVGRENLNPERPAGDYKECFNILYEGTYQMDNFPAEMHPIEAWKLWDAFEELSYRVLRLMAVGLNLQDSEFIASTHRFKNRENESAMRVNYYPAVEHETLISGQVRCGEHTDYGSITLLYTDSPGLEVVNRQTGQYEAAQFVPGGIFVNLGDMMQMWTADHLLANKHRVLVPAEESPSNKARVSIAFFCQPDNDVMIESLDSSGKYPPVRSGDWLKAKFTATYNAPSADDIALTYS